MKKISYWAKRHTQAARVLIVCVRLILVALAWFTGMELNKTGIILPYSIIYFSSFLLLSIVILVYPQRKKTTRTSKVLYLKQKACDFIMPLCSFVVIASAVNNTGIASSQSNAYGNFIIKNPARQDIHASGNTKKMLSRTKKRILRKEFFKQLKIYTAAKITGDEKTSGKAWKIALAIIAAVGLTYLLAGLACSLSCGGSDVAALLVLVLGIGGIVFGMIALMKRIHRGPPPQEVKEG